MKKLLSINGLVLILIFLLSESSFLQSQYNRNIVFEEFSEVWCGPCASLTPMLSKWFENHPDYIPVIYYSYISIGGNRVYNSPDDYQARNDFYQVPFYPYARINAELAPNVNYPGYPTDTNAINSIIDTMSKATPVKVEIDFTNNGATGNIKVALTSEEALTDKNMFVMIVEQHHHYEPQSNGLEDFHYLFRDMVTEPNGEIFSIETGETLNFDYDYELVGDFNYDLYANVIVQDVQTKHIYQSESVFRSLETSTDEFEKNINDLTIYPNPVIEDINLSFSLESIFIKNIELYNLCGTKIFNLDINKTVNSLSIGPTDLAGSKLNSGVYYLQIVTNNTTYRKKIIIL